MKQKFKYTRSRLVKAKWICNNGLLIKTRLLNGDTEDKGIDAYRVKIYGHRMPKFKFRKSNLIKNVTSSPK